LRDSFPPSTIERIAISIDMRMIIERSEISEIAGGDMYANIERSEISEIAGGDMYTNL
jgi:hypothetical protein